MSTKKYVVTFVIFALLLILTVSLFFSGLLLKDSYSVAFYILVGLSVIFLVFAIAFIAINYKALVNYDTEKLNKEIEKLDFSIIDTPISQTEIYSRLIDLGYKKGQGAFHKVLEENCGDGGIVNHYYAIIHELNDVIDISEPLSLFGKGLTTYNIGFIFINNNVEKNIEILKEYIKATILDVKVHPYKYKPFFVPFLIANNKIYYIKESGVLMDSYKFGVVEGVRIIENE